MGSNPTPSAQWYNSEMSCEIENINTDFDVAVGHTQKVFDEKHGEAQEKIACTLDVDPSVIHDQFKRSWYEAHMNYSVDPDLLIAHTVFCFQQLYPTADKSLWVAVDNILASVYTAKIDLFPDAEETLIELHSRGKKIGITTHRPPWWMNYTLAQHPRLMEIIHKNEAFCWPDYLVKGPPAWVASTGFYEFEPKKTVGVGDSRTKDVNACLVPEVGYQAAYWITRPGMESYFTHDDGPLLTNGVRIFDYRELLQLIH